MMQTLTIIILDIVAIALAIVAFWMNIRIKKMIADSEKEKKELQNAIEEKTKALRTWIDKYNTLKERMDHMQPSHQDSSSSSSTDDQNEEI